MLMFSLADVKGRSTLHSTNWRRNSDRYNTTNTVSFQVMSVKDLTSQYMYNDVMDRK